MNQFIKPIITFACISTVLLTLAMTYPTKDFLLHGPDYDSITTELFVKTFHEQGVTVTPLHSSCASDVKFEMMQFRIDDANWKRLIQRDGLQQFAKGTAPYVRYDRETDPLTKKFGKLFEQMKQNPDWQLYLPQGVDPAKDVSGPVLYSPSKHEALMVWVYLD